MVRIYTKSTKTQVVKKNIGMETFRQKGRPALRYETHAMNDRNLSEVYWKEVFKQIHLDLNLEHESILGIPHKFHEPGKVFNENTKNPIVEILVHISMEP